MKFEAIARETVLLDPNNDMTRKDIPNEIRLDPLTGKTSRICHFRELRWDKPDIDKLIAGTENWCPFSIQDNLQAALPPAQSSPPMTG